MNGFHNNLENLTIGNANFRHVLYTTKNIQLVLMCLSPGEEIGMETHEENDQFFRFEKGHGLVIIDTNEYEVSDGAAVIVPAGSKHNVINKSDIETLNFYTIYSPPHHKDGVIHRTKEESEKLEEHFEGKLTEK